MNDNAQRIAISLLVPNWTTNHAGKYCSHIEEAHDAPLPRGLFDPLADLNAMHEAEKVLTEEQHAKFRLTLADVAVSKWQNKAPPYEHMANSQRRMLVSATAAQRAEAFLKTINLWTV